MSSVHIDKVLLGQKSISLLLDRIQGKNVQLPYKETVENSLVVRHSTDETAAAASSWEHR